MIKDLTAFLTTKDYLFSVFKKIEPKQLNSRKKIEIYSTVDIKKNFISIFIVDAKSRFLIKNAKELIVLKDKLALMEEHNFKKNIFIIKSDICSKAKQYLKENKWIIYDDFM